MMIALVALGFATLGLSIYLGFILAKLKNQTQRQKQMQAEYDELAAIARKDDLESLRIITLAVSQGQCEVSEGVIRIYNLMKRYDDLVESEYFGLFSKAYEDFKQFPYLEARQELTKQERFNQDNKRFQLENDWHHDILESCKQMNSYLKEI